MWPLLTVNVQMALIGDTHYALELVAWYREIFSTYLDRGFCLYLWFARSFQYIGIARLHRTGSEHVGPVQRLFEHLVLCRRQHAPHARFLRYKLARRMPLWKTLWFPVHCGEEPMIRAAESLLIQSFRPNANFVPAAPKQLLECLLLDLYGPVLCGKTCWLVLKDYCGDDSDNNNMMVVPFFGPCLSMRLIGPNRRFFG